MSLSLGEKLRQAREDKGLTLSEVSEHTRISSLYLESIENNDYKILPGGIFNKGFVKSYAKFVGVNEQEALNDYSAILAQSESQQQPDLKIYKPEVLTDSGPSDSMLPTMLISGAILGVMTVGILYFVSYWRQPTDTDNVTANTTPKTSTNSQSEISTNTGVETPTSNIPDMATLSVELKAVNPLSVIATVDAEPTKKTDLTAGSSISFSPKERLTLNYNRWNAQNVQLAINDKPIALPAGPLDPKDRDRIIFTISKDNLAAIWTNGAISTVTPAAKDTNVNAKVSTDVPATQPISTPRQTPIPRPSVANTTSTPVPSPTRNVVVAPSSPNTNRPQ
jgi:cytoskeletal protein RodZ